MTLKEICEENNFLWKNQYASAFQYRIDASTVHAVLRYQIPFPADEEKIFMERYGISPGQRKEFYQNLLRCIHQQIKASALLAQHDVASCIRFYRAEQDRDDHGTAFVYLETDNIRPVSESVFSESTDSLEAINIAARLSVILRDIQKEPYNVTLRALDPSEVYINDDNKLVLGGFYYAASPFLPEPPPFLPTRPANIRADVLDGGTGDAGADMYSLSCMLWNLFAGIPLDAKLPEHLMVFPQYASTDLAKVLLLGRKGQAGDVAAFRRVLGKCRQAYSKGEVPTEKIWIRKQRRKQYGIVIV